jgi:SAM-dependent methyltransferase
MVQETRQVSLLRKIYRIVDERLDRSIVGNYWQRGKWRFIYRFRKHNRVPAFDELIRQAHRPILVNRVCQWGNVTSVLEIGCGRAQNLYLLSQAIPGIALCGVDISAYAITEANRELEARGMRGVCLEVGSGDMLAKFESQSWDIVIADAVTMYIPPQDITHTLEEMLRVARKGIILGAWHFESINGGNPYFYDESAWIYDYRRLLGSLPGLLINIMPYPKGVWNDDRWKRHGIVLEARV